MNRQFETATGYPASEILGKNCRFLQFRGPHALARHRLVDARVVAEMGRLVRAGRDFQGTVLNFARDGTPMLNDLLMCPIFGDRENPARVTHYAGIQRFLPAPAEVVEALKREPVPKARAEAAPPNAGPAALAAAAAVLPSSAAAAAGPAPPPPPQKRLKFGAPPPPPAASRVVDT